jgi:YD repeat-containing protein
MDDMTYTYKPNTNQLDKVVDAVADAADVDYNKYNDIKRKQPTVAGDPTSGSTTGQVTGNYTYDEIGNLTSDKSEGITNITWTVYGKINTISKTGPSGNTSISYTYDASGNRITKSVIPPSGGGEATT